MGFNTAGILIKNADELSDGEILALLNKIDYRGIAPINMEDASYTGYKGVGIGRLGKLAIVFSKDIGHSCRFEADRLTKQEERLKEASGKGDILCFAMDSVSDTYGWAIFGGGERVAGRSATDNKPLSFFGPAAMYDGSEALNEDAVVNVIEKFCGHDWVDLLFDAHIVGKSFEK